MPLVLITVLLGSSSFCWLSDHLPRHKALNGCAPVRRREMGIPLDHREALPTAQLFDREQVHAFHGEPGGEGVSEVVEAEIGNLCRSQHCRNDLLRPSEVTVTLRV